MGGASSSAAAINDSETAVANTLTIPLSLAPPGLQPGDQYHRVFVTSFVTAIDTDTTVPPPSIPYFGGLAAADYVVTYAAAGGGLITGWNSSDIIYQAILSTEGNNAQDRISITGPVYNTRNQIVANNAADLWDGSIANPIAYDEYSAAVTSNKDAWTGTLSIGTSSVSTCGCWDNPFMQAVVGILDANNSSWIFNDAFVCTDVARLYGISPAITVLPELGGDFDYDGDVDGRDFLIWQRGESPNPFSVEDLEAWQTSYDTSSPMAGASRVPEPASALIIYALGCTVLGWRYFIRFSCRSARFVERN